MDLPLASRLEERRIALGWTQGQLATVAGYHENTVRRVLRGGHTNLQTVIDVAQALGLELVVVPMQKAA